MNKQLPERVTYAQQKLIDLIQKRELRDWCLKRNLSHPLIYRIATGERLPTYALVSKLIDEIAPVEWIFYTDEQIPFEVKFLPKWDSSKPSKYVLEHKSDYRKISENCDINLESCRNLFVNHRSKPSLMIIRKCALGGVDPAEFFIEGESAGNFSLGRGDVVLLSGKKYVVLTSEVYNQKIHGFIAIEIFNTENLISEEKLENICSLPKLRTVRYSRIQPELLTHLDENFVQKILDSIKAVLGY